MNTNHIHGDVAEFLKEVCGDFICLPEVKQIDSHHIPKPYSDLLVHERDMTSTLENFHKDRIYLKVLKDQHLQDFYIREVVLNLEKTNKGVEFGVIRIHLKLFNEDTQKTIFEGKRPLGAILQQHHISYVSSPQHFIQLDSDEAINQALHLDGSQRLYGRSNLLLTPDQQVLANIIEILAPCEKD